MLRRGYVANTGPPKREVAGRTNRARTDANGREGQRIVEDPGSVPLTTAPRVAAKLGMDSSAEMMPHTSSNTSRATLRARIVPPCEPGRGFTSLPPANHSLQRIRWTPSKQSCTAMYSTTSTALRSQKGWSRCPHAYLAPLLTDEGRSTVGPKGWSHKTMS